jgi:ABC-type Fe3+-siderophore transport system permease subunit
MNIALWVLQGLLAFACLGAGGMKLATAKEKLDANPQMGWAKDFSAGQVKLIGLAQVLGAIGLIVPWVTHILPILTPIAALCLSIIMVGAVVVHIKRKEPMVPPLVLTLIGVAIAVGRSGLL